MRRREVYLKREDLNHTGAHKINNTLGQALLARRMGKKRVIAETGAGQHGVATATVAALFGLRVRRLHGRGGHPPPGAQRLPDAAAGREVVPVDQRRAHAQGRHERGHARLDGHRRRHPLHHRLGRRAAPVPHDGARFPDRSSAARRATQMLEQEGRLPDASWPASAAAATPSACSTRFSTTRRCSWSAWRPAGQGLDTGQHAATLRAGTPRRPARRHELRAAG